MELHLKQGYYKDIRSCDEIARESALYDRYFSSSYKTEDYIRSYFPDDGRGRIYFAITPRGRKGWPDGDQPEGLYQRIPLPCASLCEEGIQKSGRRCLAAETV